MIKLVHNEIIKLLKKKSFYIVTIIFILFCILTNVVYKTPFNNSLNEQIDIAKLKEQTAKLNLDNEEELLIYIENSTQIELEELKDKYISSIQEYLITHFLYSDIYNKYESKYIYEDNDLYTKYEQTVSNKVNYIKNENFKFFLEERISYLEDRVSKTVGIEQVRYTKLLEYTKYRQKNNVPYDYNNYLNNSLDFLEENIYEYINLQNDDNLTEDEEKRLEYLNENMSIHEYVIDNQKDILNEQTLREVLINFSGEFGIFILIYTIMAAGSIVSEEYQKGTIKYLLTKPHKRISILTSKLIVLLMLIPLIMLFMCIIEIIIGGLILGYDSLCIPVVLYKNNLLYTYPVITYLVSLLVSVFPMYLIVGLISFMISSITLSTSGAITIGFLAYLLGNIISNLALIYKLPIFKYFVSLYWDFSYIITGKTIAYNITLPISFIIIFLYIVIILCITYVTFIKKDVKNI